MCMDNLKDVLYHPVKFDSRNMEKLGNALGWDWLEQEGNKNVDNPGRAVGKAAGYALGSYLGGLYGAGAAGAGAAAGTAAGAGMQAAAGMTAEELAKLAAEEMMREGLMGTAQAGMEAAPSLLAPQGLANTMEAGMMETGYVPSSLLNAVKNTGETTPLSQNLMNFGQQQAMELSGGNGMGLLNRASSNMADSKNREMFKMGMNMMNPQEPQQQMPMAPPRQQAPQEPLPSPYAMDAPPPGISREEWERYKLMMGRR